MLLMSVLAAAWGSAIGFFLYALDDTRAKLTIIEQYRPTIVSKVYSSDGEKLGEFTRAEVRDFVSLNEMPLHLQKAFIATEDKLFYEHKGIRVLSFLSAAIDSLQSGRARGASTITMQLVRNIPGLPVGKERTLLRKVREILFSLEMERAYTKDEILELYLNLIFLGRSANGVEAASQQYFGKSCRDLTIAESALLAGLTRAPNNSDPVSTAKDALERRESAVQRRDLVLGQMLENGFISQEQCDAAIAEPAEKSLMTPERRAALQAEGKKTWAPNKFEAPYFVKELQKIIMARPLATEDELFEGGLQIYTTLDMRLQRAAEDALLTALDEFDAKKLDQLKREGKESEFRPVNGALVCLDNRAGCEGAVRAMVGGRDFAKEQFNTATQARRQPGSSVKPFVWAAAMDNGATPADIVVDEPVTYYDGLGRAWRPQNFSGKFGGPMTLRYALEHSINIVSIKLTARLGMPIVRSYMQRAGIESPIDDMVGLTIALGTPDITIMEQCVAYSTFAHGGVLCKPYYVAEIRDRDDFVRYRGDPEKKPDALPADVAYLMTYVMEGVCQTPGATAYGATKDLKRPRAGKTGTTNDSRDAWFCGFTADYTCVVWIGYRDQNRPLGSGANYTGGRLAAPVWAKFMVKAHEGMPVRDFTAPPGVEFFAIDRGTGLAGGGFREAFIRGARPRTAYELPPDTQGVVSEMEDGGAPTPESPSISSVEPEPDSGNTY